MKILAIGVSPTMLAQLNSNQILLVVPQEIETNEDLHHWTRDGEFNGVLLGPEASLDAESVKYLRLRKVNVPIICLASLSQGPAWSRARTDFLRAGGDDMMPLTSSAEEIEASLRAVDRRINGFASDESAFRYGEATVRISPAMREVRVNGEAIKLKPREFQFLFLLASTKRPVSKEHLLRAFYMTPEDEPGSNIIDVWLSNVRKKFGAVHSDAPFVLETLWGFGYKLGGRL